MASVGLFYVGAVLFINGVMLLGRVEPRAGAIMNLFVGGLQVVTPTFLIFTANGDQDTILLASGLYLFGFTYLYVGIGLLAGLDSTGVGWFSLFVAIAALGYSFMNFTRLAGRPVRRHLALLGVPVVPVLRPARAQAGVAHPLHGLGGRSSRVGSRPRSRPSCCSPATGRPPAPPRSCSPSSAWRWCWSCSPPHAVTAVNAGRTPSRRPPPSRPHRPQTARSAPAELTVPPHRPGRDPSRPKEDHHARSRVLRRPGQVHARAGRTRPQPLAPGRPGRDDGPPGERLPGRVPRVDRRADRQQRLRERRP